MPTINMAGIGDEPTIEDVVDAYERMRKMLDWLLNGNVDFKNIQAEGITAKNVKAGSIVTDKLAAGAVTADKITVDQLSAITADLGHITAGLIEAVTIVGSEIMTQIFGNYPRIELSATDNILSAQSSSGDSVDISALYSGSPSVVFYTSGAVRGQMSVSLGSFGITSLGTTDISIQAANNIILSANDVVLQPADDVILTCNQLRINGEIGWSGTFQNLGGETVTVENGIIVDVV